MPDETDDISPIDYLVVEFDLERATGDAFPIMVDLADRGIIRVLDLMFVRKEADGSVARLTLADMDALGFHDIGVFEGAASGLLDGDDVRGVGGIIEPGTVAGIIVYENTWAAPFIAALRRNGAQLVAHGQISAQSIIDALDALES